MTASRENIAGYWTSAGEPPDRADADRAFLLLEAATADGKLEVTDDTGRQWRFVELSPDPLDVTGRDGYVTPPTKPMLLRERPVVDDRGMVLVWVIAAIAFLLAMGATVLLVAGRPPNG